jgi:hypothetical protein
VVYERLRDSINLLPARAGLLNVMPAKAGIQ